MVLHMLPLRLMTEAAKSSLAAVAGPAAAQLTRIVSDVGRTDAETERPRWRAPCFRAADDRTLLVGADLDALHAGFGFGTGLVHAVADNDGRRRGGLLIDDGALLRAGVLNDVVLGGDGLSEGRRGKSDGKRGSNKHTFHSTLLGSAPAKVGRCTYQ